MKNTSTVIDKIADFLSERAKVLLSLLIILFILIAIYIIATIVNNKKITEALSTLDTISYNLTTDSASLTKDELDARKREAFDGLSKYFKSNNIVGVRANMLGAEIAYSNGDFESAGKYWVAASEKEKKSYTAGLTLFNAGSAFEDAGKLDDALECYTKAAGNEDFLLSSHAKFSMARLLESKGDKAAALVAYKDLNDKSPDTQWGQLAKTKILSLDSGESPDLSNSKEDKPKEIKSE